MKRFLFLLLCLPVVASGQFRMVSSNVTLDSTVNDSTYIISVNFFSDQTAKGYFASGITADHRVFSQTGQLYDITAASNLTLSSGDLTIVEIDNNYVDTELAPTGQILVFDPQGEYITYTPFGNSNMGQVLQQAIGTYNAVVSSNTSGTGIAAWDSTETYEQFQQVSQAGKIYTNRTGSNTSTVPRDDIVNWEVTNKSEITDDINGRDTISQLSHPFEVGDPLWYSGDYILAQDTGASVRVDGIVVEVIDGNTFVRQRSGRFTLSSHGFTSNIQLYVQDDGSYGITPGDNVLAYGYPVSINEIQIGVKPDRIKEISEIYDNTVTELPTTKQLAIDKLGRFQSFENRAAIEANPPAIGVRVLDRATGAQYTIDDAPVAGVSNDLFGTSLGSGKYLNIRLGEGNTLDPSWIGAIPNDSISDYSEFNAALGFLNAIGGGTLKVPHGWWYLTKLTNPSSGLIIDDYQGIKIEGAGKDSTTLWLRGISADRVKDLTIRDIGILRYDTTANFANLLELAGDTLDPVVDVYLENVRFEFDPIQPSGNTPHGTFLVNVRNIRIINCEYVNCQIKGGNSNCPIFENVIIDRNTWKNHTNLAVSVVNASGGSSSDRGKLVVKNLQITNNTVINPRGTGVFFVGADGENEPAADTMMNVVISNNAVIGDDWSFVRQNWGSYPASSATALVNMYLGNYADNIIIENNYSSPEVRDTNATKRTEGISLVCNPVPGAYVGTVKINNNVIKKIDKRPITVAGRRIRHLQIIGNEYDSTRSAIIQVLDTVGTIEYSGNTHLGSDRVDFIIDDYVEKLIVGGNSFEGTGTAGIADITVTLGDTSIIDKAMFFNNFHSDDEDYSMEVTKTDTSSAQYYFQIDRTYDHSTLGLKGNVLSADSLGTNVFITPNFYPDVNKITRSLQETQFDYQTTNKAISRFDNMLVMRDTSAGSLIDEYWVKTLSDRLNKSTYHEFSLGDFSAVASWRLKIKVDLSFVGANFAEGTSNYEVIMQASGELDAFTGDNETTVLSNNRVSGIYDYIANVSDLFFDSGTLKFRVNLIDGPATNAPYSIKIEVFNNARGPNGGENLNNAIQIDRTGSGAHALTASNESIAYFSASQITSTGDSSTVQLEITGLDSRLTTAEGSIPDNITDLTISSTVDFDDNRITGVANAEVDSDAINKEQLDSLGIIVSDLHTLGTVVPADGDTIVLTREKTLILVDGLGSDVTIYLDGSSLSSGSMVVIKYGNTSSNFTVDRADAGNFIGETTYTGTNNLSASGTGTMLLIKSGATWYQIH